ncbi:MAG: DUF3048 domain-containing protein [Bacilli bacterium]|nr:DUF3048 domain-containing protein [Bacilli bacterium]
MKKIKLKKKNIIILIAIAVVLIVGVLMLIGFLGNKDDKVILNKDNNSKVEDEQKEIKIVDLNSDSRPYAVMINNISTARSLQSGLQDAYIIYEFIVEGGLTRYMALFLDQETERIGSIRSSRHYFLDYALENDAIYVHHGQSPQAHSDFSKLGIDRIEVTDNKTGWRDKTLNVSSEHTLFTSIEKLEKGIGKKRTERKKDLLLNYNVDELDLSKLEKAEVANNVSIKYSSSVTSSYEYDADNKVYKRFINKKEHKDYVTKEQYTFKNIITYKVDNSNIAGDTAGRQNLNNIGSGEGYFISNGYAVPITWEKKSRDAQTVYKYLNGEEIVVNDGNTFIQVQPEGQTLTIS